MRSDFNPIRRYSSMAKLTARLLYEQFVMIWRSYKIVHFDLMLGLYLIIYLVVSFIVWALDPDIKGLSDALWFTFQTGTTIGYGDLLVNNAFARVVTAIFSVISMALVAVFTGILAGYFVETIKAEAKDSAMKFLLDLERLPEMSHEELVEMSERAKTFARREWGVGSNFRKRQEEK